MREQKSQHGSDIVNKKKEVKGHMALRNNVWDIREELWDLLKPSEIRMVDAIITKTIKWRTDTAKISIKELAEKTKKNHNHVYTVLKELHEKGVITKTKDRHDFILGLDPDFFGGLLIKKHADALQVRRSKIKVVVDNTKKESRFGTSSVHNQDLSGTDLGLTQSRSCTKIDTQVLEIIDENPLLKTLLKDIHINTSLKGGQEPAQTGLNRFESLKSQGKKKRTQEDHERMVREQLEKMKAGIG